MIAAVFDTNVLASGFNGFTTPASVPGELLRRWQDGAFTLIVSEHILVELARAFTDRYFTRRLTPDEISTALLALRADAVLQPISIQVQGVATQPKDDLILAAALSGNARYLVSGDRALQALGRFRSITILSPRQFLELLDVDRGFA